MEIIIWLLLLSGAVTASSAVWNLGKKTWDEIIFALKGKRIAVLGQRAVGKSSLLRCAFKEEDLEQYIQTLVTKKISKKHLKFGELDIRLRETKDVSGSKDALAEWEKLFSESDIILYLVRTDKLFNNNNEHIKRVRRDMKNLNTWIEKSQSEKQVFIVGNHWIDDPKFQDLYSKASPYSDQFNSLEIVKEIKRLGGGANKVKVALGCLQNCGFGIKLIGQIFMQVKK